MISITDTGKEIKLKIGKDDALIWYGLCEEVKLDVEPLLRRALELGECEIRRLKREAGKITGERHNGKEEKSS